MTQLAIDTARERMLAAIPADERRLELAGISTPVLEGGDGPPVVLLHGPNGSAAHWIRVIPALVATHRVIAPDLPGHGASEIDGARLDVERVSAWLAELIERTCPSPPALVGHELGGAIAARFAADHGDRIGRLVLVDALGLVPFDPVPDFGRALGEFLSEPNERTHDELWRYCAHDLDRVRAGLGEHWEPFAAYNVARARTADAQAALGALMAQFGMPAIPPADLERIAVPAELIWGRRDLATRLPVAEEASTRYGWPLHVIEDAGADPALEQPKAFVAALRTALADAAPDALRRRVRGAVLTPDEAGFRAATRLWNGLIEKRPALVVQPTGAADVVAAVDFARGRSLPVTVKGGGHNIAGGALADGGLTIDMSRLRGVAVDPDARTATVEPGCLLADVDRATQRHGLATPLGFFSEVGVAGLTLGGGIGYLSRRFGWTVDNLLEVRMVTADGRIRPASRDENPDLFWAVRGAGAYLGAVTSFTFRLHEVGPLVYGGLIAWPFERVDEILAAYRAFTAESPRELAAWLILLRAPEAPFVPPEWHGRLICAMSVCYSGSAVDEALAPIRALRDPVFDLLHEQPYVELQSHLDATEPKGDHYYWKTEYAAELSDGLLAAWRALAAECPIPRAQIGALHPGGAVNERAWDDGAVGNRDARFAVGVIGAWEPDAPGAEAFPQWIREAGERLRPFGTGGEYINFQTADRGEEGVRAAYGANFDRVAEIKRRYDPDGVFKPLVPSPRAAPAAAGAAR